MAFASQRLHQEIGVQYAWASWVCEMLACRTFDPDSLTPFATRFVGDRGGAREADQRRESDDVWWFDTEAGPCVMLTHEVQTRRQRIFSWRILNYLSGLVLNCEAGGQYQHGTRHIPLPVMIVLYRGAEPWTPPPPEQVFAPSPQAQVRAWFGASLAHVFDMHHMAEGDIPTQETLRLIFDLERTLAYPTRFVGSLTQRIRALPPQAEIAALYGAERGQALVAALTRFAHTAMRRWPSLPPEWQMDEEVTLEELEMIGNEVALRYPSLEQEGWMKGREEGRQEGQMESLRGVASLYLDEATLESCMAALQQRGLEAMPQAYQVVEAAQQAGDPAAAVAALLRGTGPT